MVSSYIHPVDLLPRRLVPVDNLAILSHVAIEIVHSPHPANFSIASFMLRHRRGSDPVRGKELHWDADKSILVA